MNRFALRIPSKLGRCCRKTSTHRAAARIPGPIVAGAIVRWKARMLKISAAKRTSASGTKYPESRSNPATSWTAKKKAEKWDAEIAMKNCKANGFGGGG